MPGYKFARCITDPNHFVNQYIDYAKDRTEASWDYHEGAAIALLSIATQGLLWKLPFIPGGLGTNLYMLNHGSTSRAKKSTVMDIAKEIQSLALPGFAVPENFTPGGLEEIMADHSGRAAVIWADEFNGHLEKMHSQSYMAGLRGFLLTMYGQKKWTYKRVSKGKNRKEEDSVVIDKAHLCLIGNTTPAIAETLKPRDIDDGFLPRFAVIWPQVYPPSKGLLEMDYSENSRDGLVIWLREIRDMIRQITDLEERNAGKYSAVIADEDAYKVFDKYQADLNQRMTGYDEQTQSMTQRLPVMALKLGMILSAGRVGKETSDHIDITKVDAEWAVSIAAKWEKWSCDFVASLRRDMLQREIDISLMMLYKNKGDLPRRIVARRLKVSKYKMDEIQMTMLDRGLIRAIEKNVDGSSKTTLCWMLPEKWEEEVANA